MNNQRVKVGIVGTGFGRSVHLPGFRALDDAVVVGIASNNPARAAQVSREFSLPMSFPSWRDLVAHPDIAAISVATPPNLNEEIVLAALSCGKAVLCEKPLAMNVSQAARMLNEARLAGVVHMVDFEFREIPHWRLLKRFLDDEYVGRLRHISITWHIQSWARASRPWSWRSDLTQGGGVLALFGVHVLDYVEWLFGPVASLSSHLHTTITERPDQDHRISQVTSEDCCNLLLVMSDSTPVNISVSAVANAGRGHWIEVYGERKTVVLGSGDLTDYCKGFKLLEAGPGETDLRSLQVPEDLEYRADYPDGRIAPFVSLAGRFVDAVKLNKRDCSPSFVAGMRAQMLIDCARQAHSEGTWVDVPKTEESKVIQPMLKDIRLG